MRPIAPIAAALLLLPAACGKDEEPNDTVPPVLSVPMIDLSDVVEFLPFGATLGSGVLNPAYELRTDTQAVDVVAVSPGVVVEIRGNVQGDAELEIRPSQRSVYAIIHDHVVSPTVGVGASVQPGDVLGQVGAWSYVEGRTELQVNRSGIPTLAHCPAQFGTAGFNQAHDDAMAATGSASPVCLAETVVP